MKVLLEMKSVVAYVQDPFFLEDPTPRAVIINTSHISFVGPSMQHKNGKFYCEVLLIGGKLLWVPGNHPVDIIADLCGE